MNLLKHIESHMDAVEKPLFAITITAVPCPDTPVLLTLHWHGFVRSDIPGIGKVQLGYVPLPSSALQLNERWSDLTTLDRAALGAAWELGAWDVAREEKRSIRRPGADSAEALECLKAFGAYPDDRTAVVSETPDADDLLGLAAEVGYLRWVFRPVSGGIWGDVAADATLDALGRRAPPCPVEPVAVRFARDATIYRFGQNAEPHPTQH